MTYLFTVVLKCLETLIIDVAKGIKSFKKGMATDVTEDTDTKNLSEDNKDTNNKE